MRPLRLPPSDFNNYRLPCTKLEAGPWFRVHATTFDPVYFSKNVDHRFSHAQAPCGCLYLGKDTATCLWERFGDRLFDEGRRMPRVLWENSVLSEITLPALVVCDLARVATRSELLVDLSALMHTDLSVPQAWSRAIQVHPAGVAGIRYLSRFTNRPCLVVFDKVQTLLRGKRLSSLPDSPAAARFLDQHNVCLH